MSHQARTDLSRSRGYNPHSPLGSPLCRTCYCRYTYSYVCFCAAAASHSYIPHRSTNDGVELPDGTPRGVRDLYPVWLPCFSTSPPSVLFLPYSRGIRASPSHARPRRGSRSCLPAPSIVAGQDVLRNANVCIPHARPSGVTIIDVRPFSFFVITPLSLFVWTLPNPITINNLGDSGFQFVPNWFQMEEVSLF